MPAGHVQRLHTPHLRHLGYRRRRLLHTVHLQVAHLRIGNACAFYPFPAVTVLVLAVN